MLKSLSRRARRCARGVDLQRARRLRRRSGCPGGPRPGRIFERVIGFKTSVGLGQVPVMAAYLADELRAAGFPEADIHIFPLGETASMVVRYRGDGSDGKPILLMAHMDVVTAKRDEWQRDPFVLVEEKGFFFGRGTFDIKGGLTWRDGDLPAAQGRGIRADA